jgi:hypothetical protein
MSQLAETKFLNEADLRTQFFCAKYLLIKKKIN